MASHASPSLSYAYSTRNIYSGKERLTYYRIAFRTNLSLCSFLFPHWTQGWVVRWARYGSSKYMYLTTSKDAKMS